MGKAMIGMLAVFAELERDIIVERILAGLETARANGTKLGPKFKILSHDKMHKLHEQGLGYRAIARQLGGVSFMTIKRRLAKTA